MSTWLGIQGEFQVPVTPEAQEALLDLQNMLGAGEITVSEEQGILRVEIEVSEHVSYGYASDFYDALAKLSPYVSPPARLSDYGDEGECDLWLGREPDLSNEKYRHEIGKISETFATFPAAIRQLLLMRLIGEINVPQVSDVEDEEEEGGTDEKEDEEASAEG